MHIDSSSMPEPEEISGYRKPWYREMTRYHWFVFVVAALGWLFDCLDQQLFVLARPAVMRDLVTEDSLTSAQLKMPNALQAARSRNADYATSIFMLGWATGGLAFGILGDRWGRAKTMVITILMYSVFTGLSSIAQGVFDFALYRFLTGLGVGGEFAIGVALVAESMPSRARAYALSSLQALSATGNISAALINLNLGLAQEQGLVESPWRIMFLIGAVPALLALLIRRYLKEPESWQKAKAEQALGKSNQLGSYRELFSDAKIRRHALLGLVLACAGVVGLWSIGFYTPDLIKTVQRPEVTATVYRQERDRLIAAGEVEKVAVLEELIGTLTTGSTSGELSEAAKSMQTELSNQVEGRLARWSSYASMAINVGAFLGMFGFGALSQKIGRKPTFALGLLAAFVSTACVFLFLKEFWQIWVMVPVMGFCQLSLFAGYAIYFPELFPTRLRSTGVSFCYNVGRFAAAGGPLVKAQLDQLFGFGGEAFRYTGATMACVFLIGLVVLPFLPETRDQELPE
ncbi:MFS transporter [Blastopirellula sp. JC732]|uniref:MFS transporter n=1 Tax=Blastopirellula sediminis TaxID=2894196 RepID=A0A9X1MQ34_9BACT|nr:MFS transporter [Blastopirellula sediminis]MCC9606412.1 MFS transporter [Blastopirellula sediminis]MCC9630290.1 MFS transporter [Blastopirellula sediminis]